MGNTLDTGANAGVNTGADTVWLTYAELGKARGTNAAAAKRLAMRRRWRRQAGNDGTTRVSVPVSEVRHWKGDAGAHTAVSAGVNTDDDTGADASVIKALESAVASLTERAAVAENRADRAEIRAEQAEARVNRAEQSLSEERKRADQAEVAANRLEIELDAEKLGRAEAEADAAELREAMQKADHDRTTAVAIADEAVRAAEELRRAEAQRAGQGRWQRLRAAWRGE
jgi:hypothetical protein